MPPKQPSSAAQTLAAWATAVASLIAFLYLVGGAALWIRFAQADVPPGRAVSVVPQSRLVETALSAVILPVVLLAVVVGGLARFLASRPSPRRNGVRQTPTISARGFAAVLATAMLVLGVLLVTPTGVGVLSYVVMCAWIVYAFYPLLSDWSDRTRPLPWRRITAFVAVLVFVIVLIQEAEKPPRLEPARVELKDGPDIRGAFITQTGEALFLGGDDSIIDVPNDRVRLLRIGVAPHEAESPNNLVEHILGL